MAIDCQCHIAKMQLAILTVGSFKATFDFYAGKSLAPIDTALVLRSYTIVHLRRSLAKIGPSMRVVAITTLVSSLRSPDYTSRGTSRIKSGMRLVTFVSLAELQVNSGVDLCGE